MIWFALWRRAKPSKPKKPAKCPKCLKKVEGSFCRTCGAPQKLIDFARYRHNDLLDWNICQRCGLWLPERDDHVVEDAREGAPDFDYSRCPSCHTFQTWSATNDTVAEEIRKQAPIGGGMEA